MVLVHAPWSSNICTVSGWCPTTAKYSGVCSYAAEETRRGEEAIGARKCCGREWKASARTREATLGQPRVWRESARQSPTLRMLGRGVAGQRWAPCARCRTHLPRSQRQQPRGCSKHYESLSDKHVLILGAALNLTRPPSALLPAPFRVRRILFRSPWGCGGPGRHRCRAAPS